MTRFGVFSTIALVLSACTGDCCCNNCPDTGMIPVIHHHKAGAAGEGGAGGFGGAPVTIVGGKAAYAPCIGGSTGVTLGPGPLPRVCVPATADECDGMSDIGPAANGANGNGFDDDCDGLVDEGCACPSVGTTKDCYLVPGSQIDATSKAPVGWCSQNAKRSVACAAAAAGGNHWDGFCKGAKAPATDDVCTDGDYDCDGKSQNRQSAPCNCAAPVTCPTEAIVIAPYPDPHDLTKKKPTPYDPHPGDPFVIDAKQWLAIGAPAQGFTWTVTGGDCDNILPHPTFAMYDGPDVTSAQRIGTETSGLGSDGHQRGLVAGPTDDRSQIWPSFALSGDYVIESKFTIADQAYACTVKVQVRAPGLRAELCWDIQASSADDTNSNTDIDLHLGRLQGPACASGEHGWFETCDGASDDWYFSSEPCNDCTTSMWGYAVSSTDACHGWGSQAVGSACPNPRLDLDNTGCDVSQLDPNANNGDSTATTNFCGPENINVDAPNAGDQFAIGVHYYSGDVPAHPHVNVYCNGERKLAFGYDPTSTPPITKPTIVTETDFWSVARVQWTGMDASPCIIEPVPSKVPIPAKDGDASACVTTLTPSDFGDDTGGASGAGGSGDDVGDDIGVGDDSGGDLEYTEPFDAAGDYPTSPKSPASALCQH